MCDEPGHVDKPADGLQRVITDPDIGRHSSDPQASLRVRLPRRARNPRASPTHRHRPPARSHARPHAWWPTWWVRCRAQRLDLHGLGRRERAADASTCEARTRSRGITRSRSANS